MPSNARRAFDQHLEDIDRLLDLHTAQGGDRPGRRYGLEVLNRSAIVLLTSYWEAYCEDIVAEALNHIVKNAKSSDSIPTGLKKTIAKELKGDPNELAIWSVSDDKWKVYLSKRLEKMTQERNRKLNTPKTHQIDELFKSAIGLVRVSSSWRWSKKLTIEGARSKLDRFVELRGEIAHRGSPANSVTKAQVTDYRDFLEKLAGRTGGAVNTHVGKITDKPLFRSRRVRRSTH